MKSRIVWLDSCGSTNDALTEIDGADHGTVAVCRRQTAGRGQRGNKWESEPGKNLTFSILLCPDIEARSQFEMSMLVSLAVADFIDAVLGRRAAKVKWPNDIYVADGKICGILIENRLSGTMLERAVAGIGINVNQTVFRSGAPNPVSLAQLSGCSYNLQELMEDVAQRILNRIDRYDKNADALHGEYMSRLYRGDGKEYNFRLPGGDTFKAAIVDVCTDGMMCLSNGSTYAFKEVAYVL